jgi:hypothetical protein
VLAGCLNPDPNARYASVEEFSEALASAAPDSCPESAERISRITNLVRHSQRPAALAQGSFPASTGPKPTDSGSFSALDACEKCRHFDESTRAPRDDGLTVREGCSAHPLARQG